MSEYDYYIVRLEAGDCCMDGAEMVAKVDFKGTTVMDPIKVGNNGRY